MWLPAAAACAGAPRAGCGAAAGAAGRALTGMAGSAGCCAPMSPPMNEWMTCGWADLPSMRTFVPACSISTPPMPRSATLSISSRISFRFKWLPLSDQLIAKRQPRFGQLETCPPVVAAGPQHEQDEVLRRNGGEERDVFLGDERELMHVARIQLRVGDLDGLDEAAELGAEDVDGDAAVVDGVDGDAVETDEADGQRAVDAVADPAQHVPKHATPWIAS